MKNKIAIKSFEDDTILFMHECEGNTVSKTLKEARKNKVDLNSAVLTKEQALVGSFYFESV